MDLLKSVQDYIIRHALLKPGDRVVVGVSGGPDSVALLHILTRLAKVWELRLHIAHLHHGIRGTEADADASAVIKMAQALGWTCTLEKADIPAIAAQENMAIEETARRVRYAFLAQEARRVGAQNIAVAHNSDDQAETVLMHLLRGAGPAGLRGMLPMTPLQDYRLLPSRDTQATKNNANLRIIRPLLETPRVEIEAYCNIHHLETRFDCSNLDTTYFRNRLRHEVLPYLGSINPGISERLISLAEIIRADYALLEEFTQVAWDELVIQHYKDAVCFSLDGWRAQPLSVRRSLIRRAAYSLRRSLRDVDFTHVENAIQIAQYGATGSQATLPMGLELQIGYTTLTIGEQGNYHLPPERPWLDPGNKIEIHLPSTYNRRELSKTTLSDEWIVITQYLNTWDAAQIINNENTLAAWMDADVLHGPLVLRTREPGDRFYPQGLQGSKVRLSDLLVNVKLPKAWRPHLPLLTLNGKIMWVVGVRLSHQAMVTRDTQCVLHMRFIKY
ncbi:MAG: tRNA lysidine(34) synthetase TilS [Anaerolineae bacterium]|nr:tRNA lysidine(34) synthetase TilS [Anaerolineae bacterium]